MAEGYANPTVLNGTAGNSAPVMGGRRRKSLRKVSAKTIRKTLKHMGLKPKGRVVLKGGADDGAAPPVAGGRRKSRRAPRRKSGLRRMFGL
jgi:hypothetical protein